MRISWPLTLTYKTTSFKRAEKTCRKVFRVSQYKSDTFSKTHRSEVDCKALNSDRRSTKFAMLNPGAKPNLHAPPLHVEAMPVKTAKLADLKRLLRYLSTNSQAYMATLFPSQEVEVVSVDS